MTAPPRPDHADRESSVAGAPGFAIRRVLTGYAYPQNGNVHNPTPRYRFSLLLDGRAVDSSHSDRELRRAAKAPNARRDYTA